MSRKTMKIEITAQEWETGVVDYLSIKLNIHIGAAVCIVEANQFYLSQAWGLGLNPEKAADHLINKTK